MPRKPKKKPVGQTYFKSKNNRWYKKIQVDGKTRCRFVSKAEVEGAVPKKKASNPKPAPSAGSSSQTSSQPPKPPKPPKPKSNRRRRKKGVASAD